MAALADVLDVVEAWSCCDLAAVPVERLAGRERDYFADFFPEAVTAIVLGHHVTTETEWTWYAKPGGGERCAADDHLLTVCRRVEASLERRRYAVKLVEYPRQSGLEFRRVAQAAGLGTIGTNAFLFHPAWGPWVHLRVMATTARIETGPRLAGSELCDGCGQCIEECPAGAISPDGFDGLQCREFRRALGEYEPWGERGELRYCLRCAWVCPQGNPPVPKAR